MIYRFMYDNVIGIAYYAKLSMRKSTKKHLTQSLARYINKNRGAA